MLERDVERYSLMFGPSGAEDEIIRAIVGDLEGLGFRASVDPLGNVVAPIHSAAPGFPTVMITAHSDEVGFVVRKIGTEGFLRVHRVGGINDRVIAGQRLVFQAQQQRVYGVVGVKAKHASSPDELRSAVTVDDAYVDLLVPSAEAVMELGLDVGALGTFVGTFQRHGDYISSKALDDRAGIALLIDVARRVETNPPKVGVVLVATCQEEFSVRGGTPAARAVAPDLALCLDIAMATDTPDMRPLGDVVLGGGPVIGRFSRASLNGIIPNPKLWRFAAEVASREGLPTQFGVMQGGLTDGSFMQYEASGIPTLDVGFPTRYTHTPVETCHLGDLRSTAELTFALLRSIPENFDLARGAP